MPGKFNSYRETVFLIYSLHIAIRILKVKKIVAFQPSNWNFSWTPLSFPIQSENNKYDQSDLASICKRYVLRNTRLWLLRHFPIFSAHICLLSSMSHIIHPSFELPAISQTLITQTPKPNISAVVLYVFEIQLAFVIRLGIIFCVLFLQSNRRGGQWRYESNQIVLKQKKHWAFSGTFLWKFCFYWLMYNLEMCV